MCSLCQNKCHCFLYLEGRFDVFKFGRSLLVNKETTFYQWAELKIGGKKKKTLLKIPYKT